MISSVSQKRDARVKISISMEGIYSFAQMTSAHDPQHRELRYWYIDAGIKPSKNQICLNDRVMTIDLQISNKIICIIGIYLLHTCCASNYFQNLFDDLNRLVMEAYGKQYKIIIGGNFNLNLNERDS